MPNSHVTRVSSVDFDSQVTQSELPVFIDVTAPWCSPCRAASPVVARLAEEFADRLKVVEIDGGESPELVARLGVRGFPTFLGVCRGDVVDRRAGFAGARALEQMAESLCVECGGARA